MIDFKPLGLMLAVTLAAPGVVQAGTEQAGTEQAGTLSELREQWNATMERLGSYSAAQRDKALAAGEATLEAMDRRIENMQSWTQRHWDSLSDETRDERRAVLRALREQRNNVAEWYGGMKHGSGEAWESTKQGFIDSYQKLQDTYGAALDEWQSEGPEAAEQPASQ